MANKTAKSDTQTDSTSPKTKSVESDLGQSQVQARMDKETSQGFRGKEVDPTPNEHYSVAGVIAGRPTPETDAKAAQKAREVTGGVRTAVEQNEADRK